MMNINEFIERMKAEVRECLPDDVYKEIIIDNVEIVKMNDQKLYGLTFKENVDDYRESPTLQLLQCQREHLGQPLKVYDPYIQKDLTENQYHDLDAFLNDVDLVVVMVKHDQIRQAQEKLSGKIVLDCCNIIRLPGVYRL